MTRIIGIDPGVAGAVGILASDGALVDVLDMPTVIANRSSNRQQVDAYGLAKIVRNVLTNDGRGEVFAIVENVQPMPSAQRGDEARRSMGAASAFAFGKSCGVVLGILAALGISTELVAPRRWKNHFGLASDKEQSRELAIRTWPTAALNLKKHHNRAEALLLARYYRDVHLRPTMNAGPFPF